MLDCAIIGAGLAGLVAARDLRNRGLGVVVIEARDRVGGRVENGVLADGQYVELGGQWIGAGHDAIFELIERYGLRTVGIPARGNLVVRVHGRLLEVPSAEDGAELTPFEVADLSQGLLRLRRLAHRLADDPAWVAANGAWLRQDLRRWVRTNLRTGGAQARFGEVYEAAFGPMIPHATLEEGLRQINSGPSLETMIANNGGLNQQRIDGGMVALCEALAQTYPEIRAFELTDFKVRILDAERGTRSIVRVLIEITDGERSWSTVGVGTDIIEASWEALTDGHVVGLIKAGVAPR